MKLSTLLILGTIAIFVTFAIYGYYSFSISIQEVNKLFSSRNERVAFNLMQNLDEYIDKRIEDFRKVSKIESIKNSLKNSNQKFSTIPEIEKAIETQDIISKDKNKPFNSSPENLDLQSELQDVIQFYTSEYNYDVVSELFVTNEYGVNIATGTGVFEYRYDDEIWWQETKSRGIHVGEMEYDANYDEYVTKLGLRIDDDNGNFLGVLGVSLTLNDLVNGFINDVEILNIPNRSILLINESGQILYSNDILNFNNSTVPYFDQIQKLKDLGTINISTNPDDARLISFAKSTGYKQFEGFGWTVIVDQTGSSFTDEFIGLKNSFIVISILGILSAVIISLVLSYFISNPLRSLNNMAKQFSVGNFNPTFKGSKLAEINTIGNSFNLMGKSLDKLIETEKQLAETHAKIKNERLTAIGQLSSSMAHDLKNPLATIRTSATIIEKQIYNKDPEVEKAIQRMNRAIFRMSHQVDDVLNFVRTTPLNLSEEKLSVIFNNSIDSLEIPANIQLKISDPGFTILCDSKKLESVFTNIILNSIQAIGNAEGSISIQSKITNDVIEIKISNSGPEIPQGIMEKIFEPLFTTKEKGTGLGLAFCKNIVEQHGGTIHASNHPTSFLITLPKKITT